MTEEVSAMIRTALLPTAFAAATLLGASVAPAQEATLGETRTVLGSITGTLDLLPAEWRVMEQGEDGGSYWREEGDAILVRMMGVLDGTGDANRVVVSFALTGPISSPDASDVEIAMTHPDFDRPLQAERGGIVALTTVTQLSGSMVLAGDINALLQVPGAERGDAGDVTLDGNFQVTLPENAEG